LLIKFLFSSGVRVKEAVLLTKSDLVLDQCKGHVIEGKGNK